MPLFPHVPFDPAETALSIAARLAATHTGGRLGPFLTDLGIKPLDFASGKREAVIALCDHAALPADAVISNTPISTVKGVYRIREEVVSADFLSNPLTVFCPACLLADDASSNRPEYVRLGRFEWPLRVVRTCPVHGIALCERRPQEWDDRFHEMSVRVPERGAELRAMAQAAKQRTASPLQLYALSRLDGHKGPEWLDSQTLEQAVRATEQLGVLVEFGPARALKTLTVDDWDQAGRTGFEFSCRGDEGIRQALHQIRENRGHRGRRPSRRRAFGRLYEWVGEEDTARDPGDIKRIVREHIFETVAVAAGEPVLGESLTERRLHCVASLAKESRLNPKTLTHVMMAKGLISANDPTRPFDAAAGRNVAAAMTRLVHVNDLRKALGCSRPQASGLINERILPQIATGEAGTPGRTQKSVDQHDVDTFLAALKARARMVDTLPAGYVPIAKAAEKVKAPSVDIVHLILGGYLEKIVSHSGMNGYAAIHVEPSEVYRAISEVLSGVAPSLVAAKVGIPVETAWALIDDDGISLPALPSTVIRTRTGQHVIRRVTLDDFEQFRAQYLTPGDIANFLDTARIFVERDLRRYRVPSAYSTAQIGVDLYRMEDLPLKLHPVQLREIA